MAPFDVLELGAERLDDLWGRGGFPGSPRVSRGFHHACADLAPERRFGVYAGQETFPLTAEITAVSLPALANLVASGDPR